ncbi:MAG: hypothetical protein HYX47_13770 [Burkholderiales bacterium]|nr:hypothetical protein [Burkholderiales bacterium]
MRRVTKMFARSQFITLSCAAALAACGGGSEPTTPEVPVESPKSLQCKARLDTQRTSPNAVENSYIVAFKPSTPSQPSPIWPPVRPPLGDPSSGQSKEQLAAELGIQGKVIHILDNINAAVLQIDAAEARRLCADPRVSYVDQNMLTTLF